MKKISFIFLLSILSLLANAQCFEIVFKDALTAYKNGYYFDALEKLDKSAKCPDSKGSELTQWRDSCRIKIKIQMLNSKELLHILIPDSTKNISQYFYNLALADMVECHFEEAARNLRFARLSPDLPGNMQFSMEIEIANCDSMDTYNNRAIEHYKKFEYKLAKEQYQKILQIKPNDTIIKTRIHYCENPVFTKNDFVLIKGGTFMMGWSEYIGRKIHKVTLSDFYMNKYQITNAEYSEFLNIYGDNYVTDGRFKNEILLEYGEMGIVREGLIWKPFEKYEDNSVVNITWFGSNTFCEFWGLKLPSEAQWEYAAMNGGREYTSYYIKNYENFQKSTSMISSMQPNEIGIYGIVGYVFEWCLDYYSDNFDQESNGTLNPVNTTSGFLRVLRGQSFKSHYDNSYDRRQIKRTTESFPPGNCTNDIGFRPILSP
jgi:sulfatase modifying factor 1